MIAGNKSYATAADIAETIPVFALPGTLLLPGGQMPLNVFEPRYLNMVDDVLKGERLIGMVQPHPEVLSSSDDEKNPIRLCDIGGLGRVTTWQETGDGRYLINLTGICRFRLLEEKPLRKGYRRFQIAPFLTDLETEEEAREVDREALLTAFKAYLESNEMDADWESIGRAPNETLVNALCMMCPYGAAEKQALLEAPDLKTRADTLIAITEIFLAQGDGGNGTTLQ